jgi:hypothetical protein
MQRGEDGTEKVLAEAVSKEAKVMTSLKLERLIEKFAEKLRQVNKESPLPESMNGSITANLNDGNFTGKVNIKIDA